MTPVRIALFLLAWSWFGWLAVLAAETNSYNSCLSCHEDQTPPETAAAGKEGSFADRLTLSVHKTNTCTSCHLDITPAHPDSNAAVQPANCTKCHVRQSESYRAGVHGLALAREQKGSATCADCHGAHNILPLGSPSSPLHPFQQAKTCGACHEGEARDVEESVHGKAVAAGHLDAPACADCHAEHTVRAPGNRSSSQTSVEFCSRCHASERLNTKYNLPTDRVRTFFGSYHGLAIQNGSTRAANCASCHGAHKILPSTDPRSSIYKTNLSATCGKCHPEATDNFAQEKVHVDATAATGTTTGEQINRWVRRVYLVLITGTIGLMFAHNLLLFLRKVRARCRAAGLTILRMSLGQRLQHLVLAASFITLAVTGFALKFPDSWLAKALGSNEILRRVSHRVAGVVLLAIGAYHVVYLLTTREGRQLIKDFLPTRKDLKDVADNARYLTTTSTAKPKIGRFGYVEKLEYWSVVWGTLIMGITGLVIWFKMDVTRLLPRWTVDIAFAIHYYEAILACLAIIVWHFYHVIFDPDVYPLNPACWNGRVSKPWHEQEHPLDQPPSAASPPKVSGTISPNRPSDAPPPRPRP